MNKFCNKLALEASAGSGKTFALVVRYLTLLFLKANPKEILALTFTNKAANEMKVRIFTTIKELHLESRKNELNEISKNSGLLVEEILDKRDEILTNFVKSQIHISTIDSFLNLILRQFVFEVGLMSDFKIEFGIDENIYKTFLQNCIEKKNYEQLTHLSIFENKKLELIFGFFYNLYEKDAEITNLQTQFSNFDDTQTMNLFWELQANILTDESVPKRAKDLFRKVNNIMELQKSSWITRDSLIAHSYMKKYSNEFREELFLEIKKQLQLYILDYEKRFFYNLFKLYKIYKYSNHFHNQKSNQVAFNDVTNLVHKIVSTTPKDFLFFRLDTDIKHILLDEFQDTSVIQYKILEPFFHHIDNAIQNGKFYSIFFVGDKKQSIYRFRGGAKELFDYFHQTFHIEKQSLNYNFRSRKKVVDYVNKIFEKKIKGYEPQISIDLKNRGYICVTQNDEIVTEAVSQIKNLIDMGLLPNTITILTHTNNDSAVIEEAIIKTLNIRVTTETSALLINDKVVKSIILFLKYLYFRQDIYKAGFLATIGQEWAMDLDSDEFSLEKSSFSQLVNQIIITFNFKIDTSVLKFIELVFEYRDIEEFLFKYEKISETVEKKQSDGVKILTIHKSKGLEFDHVIVADRLGRGMANNATILYDYDEIELKKLYKREPNRKFFDEDYKRVLDKEDILSYEDNLNAQYVAFTRSAKSLIIVKKTKSAFDSLNLEECEFGKIEIGYKKEQKIEIQNFDYPDEFITPNFVDLVIKSEKKKPSVRGQKAINFGLATHYLLQMLYKFDKNSLEGAFGTTKNRYSLDLNEIELENVKARVTNLLENKFFQTLHGDSKNIYKEQPIFYKNQLKIIDLVIEKEDYFVIIDYKTSATEAMEYRVQVAEYKEAVEQEFGKKAVGYLCYLNSDEIKFIGV